MYSKEEIRKYLDKKLKEVGCIPNDDDSFRQLKEDFDFAVLLTDFMEDYSLPEIVHEFFPVETYNDFIETCYEQVKKFTK